jgi:uroporphyrinogen-III synthase
MKVETSQALDGRTILVTRPAHQANVLTQLIEQAGGRTLLFPAMAIEPPLDPRAAVALLHEIASFDLSIFVSANAVEQAFALAPGLARGLRTVFAVGAATARALQSHGIADVIVPEDAADSEALLRLPQLENVRDQRVLIVRGEGGRELLADTLEQRGALVRRAECYRRARPNSDPSPLLAQWQAGRIDAVIAMSTNTLTNLWDLLGESGRALLIGTPLFVPHARIAEAAAHLGLTDVAITDAGDEGVVRGLSAWFALR